MAIPTSRAASAGAPVPDAPVRPSLREAQKGLTRSRIVDALAELISEEHPLEVSMAAVAERAAVSEPTLYRYFPTKRDLFGALASDQYARVAEGVSPTNTEDLARELRSVYRRAEENEATVRWLLAAPDPAGVPRTNVENRLAVLREALADHLAPLSRRDGDHLLRAVLLITSPMAALYWKDYLGLDTDQAADTAAWMIRSLTQV